MPDEARSDDPTPMARPVETTQSKSMQDRWEQAKPQVAQALHKGADAMHRLADQLDGGSGRSSEQMP